MPSDMDIRVKALRDLIMLEDPHADYTKLTGEELLAKIEMLKMAKETFDALPAEWRSSDLRQLLDGIGGKVIEACFKIGRGMGGAFRDDLADLPGADKIFIELRFRLDPKFMLSDIAKVFIASYYEKHIKKIPGLFVEIKQYYDGMPEKLKGDKLKEASEKLGLQFEDIDTLERMDSAKLPAILKPKDRVVQKLCDKYRAKYGIDIYGVLIPEGNREKREYDPSDILEKAKKNEKSVFGAIIGQPNGERMDEGHVTPVLFFKYNDKWQCVILDSLGSSLRLMPIKGIKNYISITLRQTDNASCRTDALLILRNALLHIKYMEKQAEERGEVFTVDKFLEGYIKRQEDKNGNILVNTPLEWGFSSQIFPEAITSPKLKDLHNYRQYFSNDPGKKSHPETIAAHRDRYTAKVNITESYVGQKKDKASIERNMVMEKDYNTELQQKAEKYHKEIQELEWKGKQSISKA